MNRKKSKIVAIRFRHFDNLTLRHWLTDNFVQKQKKHRQMQQQQTRRRVNRFTIQKLCISLENERRKVRKNDKRDQKPKIPGE